MRDQGPDTQEKSISGDAERSKICIELVEFYTDYARRRIASDGKSKQIIDRRLDAHPKSPSDPALTAIRRFHFGFTSREH
jgi:hypothetical protein